MSTLETQPVDQSDGAAENSDFDEETIGSLDPLSPSFRRFLLSEDCSEWTFGRNCDCDYDLNDYNRSDGAAQKDYEHYLKMCSKLQFTITKEIVGGKTLFFVRDGSANGTFIDGVKIGKGETRPLKPGSAIALAMQKNKAFVFRLKTCEKSDLPAEFDAKYAISDELGRGACGVVRLCFTKKDFDQKFAVKIFENHTKTSVFDSEIARPEEHNREVEILRAIDHPNIVKIYDVYENAEKAMIVLEFVDGGDLFSRLATLMKLPPHDRCVQAKKIFAQIVLAVKYLHHHGITHRDLKPENILVTGKFPNLIVKITDFGLSKQMSALTVLKTFCGTPEYFAPEIIECNVLGQGIYTQAVDCWSLGVVLFLLLVGYPPFSDQYKDLPLGEQIRRGKARIFEECWKGIDASAKDLVMKMIEKDVSKRLNIDQVWDHGWLQDTTMRNSLKRLIPNLDIPESPVVENRVPNGKRNRDRAFSTSPVPADLKKKPAQPCT